MIKQLILLVQVLGLFFYQLIFTGDLAVTQKVPSTLVQGQESLIEITINKDDVAGFAKVQQLFPEGFTVEPVETKGATFSFKDKKVKFIWMALPAEREFTISYKVKPNETTSGDFTLGGKFSFISESERKNIVIPEANFSVSSPEIIADVVEEEPVESSEVEEEVVEESKVIAEPTETIEEIEESIAEVVEAVEVSEEVVEESSEAPANEEVIEEAVEEVASNEPNVINVLTIKCLRTISNIGEGKFKVTVEIDKKGIEGFAKITEEIPEGFTATEENSNGGVFSFKNGDAKILWMAVPKEDVYSISYILKSNEGTAVGNYNVKGYFSYLDNDITSKYNIDGSGFELSTEDLIVAKVEEEPLSNEESESVAATESASVNEPVVNEGSSSEVAEPVANNEVAEVTSTPNPDHGVNYKVQVGAGHKKVPSTYFKTKFNLKDNVSTINHEGWIKYLVGSFDEYKSARDKRNIVRGNVKTAFVTAYNSGTRITVQEALMISRQKWYK